MRMPSGARYWTVLDEELAVVAVADSFLRQHASSVDALVAFGGPQALAPTTMASLACSAGSDQPR